MAYENFTTYSTGGDEIARFTITENKNNVDTLDRDDDAWLYDDKGAGHFSGDFTHLLEVTPTGRSGTWSHCGVWVLANAIGDSKDLDDASEDFLELVVRHDGTNYVLDLNVWENGSTLGPERSSALTLDTKYYLTIARDDDAGDNSKGELVVTIRTGSHSGSVVDTLTESGLTEQNDFQYIYAGQSRNTGSNGNKISCDIENLDLQEGGGAETYTDEVFAIAGIQSEALDNTVLSEAVDLQTHCGASAVDNLILADQIQVSLGISGSAIDSHIFSESVTCTAGISSYTDDVCVYCDSVNASPVVSGKCLDNVIFTDIAETSFSISGNAIDSRVLSETVTCTGDISTSIDDAYVYSDPVKSVSNISGECIDNYLFEEDVNSQVSLAGGSLDDLTFVDIVNSIVTAGCSITENGLFTDLVDAGFDIQGSVTDNFVPVGGFLAAVAFLMIKKHK